MNFTAPLILIRHGESEGNLLTADERARLEKGTNTFELTEKGKWQCEKTKEWLESENIFYLSKAFGLQPVIYHSYYTRAKQTAEIIFAGAKMIEDPRLVESNRGVYHGLTKEEMLEKYPEEVRRKEREGLYHYRPWGGENWPDVELRLISLLNEINNKPGPFVFVGHGHCFLLLEKLLLGFSHQHALMRYLGGETMKNAAVTIFERGCLVVDNFAPWEYKRT